MKIPFSLIVIFTCDIHQNKIRYFNNQYTCDLLIYHVKMNNMLISAELSSKVRNKISTNFNYKKSSRLRN